MNFRTFASRHKLNKKSTHSALTIMDKQYELALLLQKLFIDNYPPLKKTSIYIRKGKDRIHVVGSTRKFDTVQTLILCMILSVIVYTCGRATSIVAPRSSQAWMDVRIWAWSLMIVTSICGATVYYLWCVKEKKTTIFWTNEMLQLELDLKNGKST